MPSVRTGTFYLAAILASFCLCASAPSSAGAQRMVFAHYMLTNQDYQSDSDPTQEAKIASYQKEIQQAKAIGIDGFALNVGGWFNQPYYIRYAAQMFEAAFRLNNGFKLFFSDDMCCGNGAAEAEDMMRRFASSPRYSRVYLQHEGKFVISTFSDKLGPEGWAAVRHDLATGAHPSSHTVPHILPAVADAPSNRSLQIFVVPSIFWGGEIPARAEIEKGVASYAPVIDGAFYWGIAGVPASGGTLDQDRSSASYADVLHHAGKLYMAPVCFQFWGANANRYYEYGGFAGMRSMWLNAINVTHPDWIEIITWNDFIEATYVSPIDDPNKYESANYLNTTGVPSSTLGYFHTHRGASDLLSYFIAWYKTGTPPALHADSLYWAYRTQPLDADAGTPTVAHRYGPIADVIYVTANLTDPATLTVVSGKNTTILDVPAGSTDIQAAFDAGEAPSFTLVRHGKRLLSAVGSDPIDAKPKYNNYSYSTGSATDAAPSTTQH